MSQENVELVMAHYDSFSQLTERDEIHAHVLGYYDPDCEYLAIEEIESVRGHDALIGWTQRWIDAWSSFDAEVEEIIDAGDVVVAVVDTSARGRTSGVEVRQRFFHVFELRQGKIVREGEFLDRDSALRAAGLSK